MKTRDGFEYEWRPGSARIIDLAERLTPVFNQWAEENVLPGQVVSIIICSDEETEALHQITAKTTQKKVEGN